MNQSQKQIKRRKRWPWVTGALVIIATAAFFFLNSTGASATDANIRTASVEKGSIVQTVVGTGNLQNNDTEDIKIPDGLKYSKVYVESGDYVSEGDVLADIDPVSLANKIASVQDKIIELDNKINDAKDNDGAESIKARVSGRVKKIYASEGSSVKDIMLKDGALMLLSIDEKMVVEFETTAAISAGDKVDVILSDDKTKEGTVKSYSGGLCAVTLTDNGPEPGEKVSVKNKDGLLIGSGELQINQPFLVLGVTGTVKTIHVAENDKIGADKKLITLTEAPLSSDYQKQVSEREELAKTLQTLLQLSESNTLKAPFDGTVENVNISDGSSTVTNNSSSENSDTNLTEQYMQNGSISQMSSSKASPDGVEAVKLVNTGNMLNGGKNALPLSLANDTAPSPSPDNGGDNETPNVSAQAKIIESVGGLIIAPPVTGAAPQSAIAPQQEFTGSIVWSPADSIFMPETVYNAGVALTANPGYVFPDGFTPSLQGATISNVTITPGEVGNTVAFQATYPRTAKVPQSQSPQDSSPPTSTSQMPSYSGYSGSYGGSVDSSALTAAASSDASSGDYAEAEVTVITMAPDGVMILTVNIDELDILFVEAGQESTIIFDAIPDKEFEGSLSKIASSTTVSGGVSKYAVEISMPKDASMRAGMTATATIQVDKKDNILTLPLEAVQESGNRIFIYTGKDEKTGVLSGEKDITTGVSDGVRVEITGGLSEGDSVYYALKSSEAPNNRFGSSYEFGGGRSDMIEGE